MFGSSSNSMVDKLDIVNYALVSATEKRYAGINILYNNLFKHRFWCWPFLFTYSFLGRHHSTLILAHHMIVTPASVLFFLHRS